MSKSSEIVGSIDDILTQILLRLPVKSLIRFKSVSKHWFSLITNPKFCHLQSQKVNPAIGLFFRLVLTQPYEYISLLQKPTSAPSINLEFNNQTFSSILQSCNGLLFCCTLQSHHHSFSVYNPTTNHITFLPEFQNGSPRGKTLVFDPVKSPHYKVVFVQAIKDIGPYQIVIYSSKTRDWMVWGGIGIDRDGGDMQFENGAYWNGAIHWISNQIAEKSLRFHVETQVLYEMPTPPVQCSTYWGGNCYFGESCDHLHYIEPGTRFSVYEMKRDYSEWFVKYFVDLSPVIVAYPEVLKNRLYYDLSVLSLVRSEKDEDSILVLLIPGKAIKYNLVDRNFEKLIEFEGEGSLVLRAKGFPYIESLSYV